MPLHSHPSRRFRWLTRIGFVVALALTLFFAARVISDAVYWSDPRHTDQQIEGWMPLGYIARSWDVPRDVVYEAVEIRPDERRWRRLERVAEARDVPVQTLIDRIGLAIQTFRQAQSPDQATP